MRYFLLFLVVINFSLAKVQGQTSQNMSLLYHWNDTSLVVSNAHLNRYNEVWGYAANGREYAIIGSTVGTHIFDVTNPTNAQQVDMVPGTHQGVDIVHRDYHDYGDYLYMVCDEGPSKLQIADLSMLPNSAPLVYESDTLFQRSHNIFIDPASGLMYVCGSTYHLMVFSLADPLNPQLLVNCSQDVAFWDNTIGYVHDIFVRNDTAYCNAGNEGLFICDFSDPANPQLIGSMDTYQQQGYNHSGWLHPTKPYYVMADENHGLDLKMVDVSSLSNLNVVSTFNSGVNDSLSIPHNVIIHQDKAFVSYYHDGVYVYDISDPNNPVVDGFYDTSTEVNATNYRGSWGIYPLLPSGILVASDMQNGLYILQPPPGFPLGEEELKATTTVSVFPNPFENEIQVRIPQYDQQNLIFELFDLSGKRLLTTNLLQSETVLPLDTEMDAGMYLYRIIGTNTTMTGKLTRQ